MKIKKIFLLFIVVLFSCNKTKVKGVVYSKHGFPVPNGIIILSERNNAKAPSEDKIVTTTLNNGEFYFEFRHKYSKQYWVRCESDSGLALGVPLRNNGTIILDTY